MSHHVSEYPGPVLNGEVYELMDSTDRTRIPASQLPARVWSQEMKPQASQYTPRADTRPSDIPEEWVITWDDWSKGSCGDQENLEGCIHFTENANGFTPGVLKLIDAEAVSDIASNPVEGHPRASAIFNDELYVAYGRKLYRAPGVGGATLEKDFGTGILITDMKVQNSELVVCFGGSTTKIWKRNTAGTWTQATDAVYSAYYAEVAGRPWDATAGNLVRNIAPTDNPLTLANYSTGISVGTAGVGITDLNAYGQQVAVSKPDGLYLGDAGAVFPNVLPQMVSNIDAENGVNTLVIGSQVIYPHTKGMILYDEGASIDCSIPFPTTNVADRVPSTRPTALCSQDKYVWVATQTSAFPRAVPTEVAVTANNGSSFTTYATLADTDVLTVANTFTIDATNNWIAIGYSARFFGLVIHVSTPNSVVGKLSVQYLAAAGAWTDITASYDQDLLLDETLVPSIASPETSGTTSLRRSGFLLWTSISVPNPTWAAQTLNGTSRFWVRIKGSASLSAGLSEIQIVTAEARSYIWRGRQAHGGDVRQSPIIWEPYGYCGQSAAITTLLFYKTGQFSRFGSLLAASIKEMRQYVLPGSGIDPIPQVYFGLQASAVGEVNGIATMAKHDGGMPEVNKQWLSIIVKGRSISSDRDVTLDYRMDENTTWVTGTSITTSPKIITLTGVTGRAFQWRINFGNFTSDVLTEVNQVEVRFRLLPTLKRVWSYVLKLQRGQRTEVDVQMTNLEALVGAAAVTHIDPLRRTTLPSVNVLSMGASELYTDGNGLPALAVPITCADV